MSKVEQAMTYFSEGYSCSQAILAAYGPELGLDRDNAVKLASTFSGGMGMTGETCGAVTGALMALGLKFNEADAEAKAKSIQRAKLFLGQFQERHGSTLCMELIAYDHSTPDIMSYVRANNLTQTTCPKFVRTAAEILEGIE